MQREKNYYMYDFDLNAKPKMKIQTSNIALKKPCMLSKTENVNNYELKF